MCYDEKFAPIKDLTQARRGGQENAAVNGKISIQMESRLAELQQFPYHFFLTASRSLRSLLS